MEAPLCPYCQVAMKEKEVPAFKGLYRIHTCPSCQVELKQSLVSSPLEKTPNNVHQECPECAFGDVHCCDCDDSLCPEHIRTIDKYANFLSKDAAEALSEQYAGQIFCPLCFQAAIKRFNLRQQSTKPAKPKLFNIPAILGLLSVLVIIIIGLERCDAAKQLQNEPENVVYESSEP